MTSTTNKYFTLNHFYRIHSGKIAAERYSNTALQNQ